MVIEHWWAPRKYPIGMCNHRALQRTFDVRTLLGDNRRGISPLEQLYVRLAFGSPKHYMCAVNIDSQRVWVGVSDAHDLFLQQRNYLHARGIPMSGAAHLAAQLWEHLGPQVDDKLPTGTIRLEAGYIQPSVEGITRGNDEPLH